MKIEFPYGAEIDDVKKHKRHFKISCLNDPALPFKISIKREKGLKIKKGDTIRAVFDLASGGLMEGEKIKLYRGDKMYAEVEPFSPK